MQFLGHEIKVLVHDNYIYGPKECNYQLLIGKVRYAWGTGKEIRGMRRTQ